MKPATTYMAIFLVVRNSGLDRFRNTCINFFNPSAFPITLPTYYTFATMTTVTVNIKIRMR